jgi:hypothetical protein
MSGLHKQISDRGAALAAAIGFVAVVLSQYRGNAVELAPAALEQPSGLPLPSSLSVADYEAKLFPFLNARKYRELGWRVDKQVRDTGPFIGGKYYGTHPAVRIYYSPEVMTWLEGGRQTAIPDGAMIIKEQFEPPAARYVGLDDDPLFERLSSWTVMVKDSAGSHDGWFWSNPAKNQEVMDSYKYPFDEPVSGFGVYCVRCHASAKTAGATNEYTFASLRNIEGFPGEPLLFRVDDSWRKVESVEEPGETEGPDSAEGAPDVAELMPANLGTHPRCTDALSPEQCTPLLNLEFLELFPSVAPLARNVVSHLPPVTHDWVVRRPKSGQATQPFVTSNQCMSCHAGLTEPFGPAMFFPTTESAEYGAPGVHLSPYGEWRWTPMGLAGRDPIFYAQLESEVELVREDFPNDPKRADKLARELVATCLKCHGAMGKHQFTLDHGAARGEFFSVDHVMQPSNDPHATGEKDWRYGALARDGISCTICHQMEARQQPPDDHRPYLEFFLETSVTGNINLGNIEELHGPFEDKELAPYAMEHAMGFKPKHNPYMKSAQLCGTCHVVNLPIMDRPETAHDHDVQLITAEQNPEFKGFHHHVEQATYLEWLNSDFENELNPDNPNAKTCQDCHMARDYHNDKLDLHMESIETRIAGIQDNSYPEAENLASHEELEVRQRTSRSYARHNFRGLNVFLLEMFNQFDDILGVRKYDFMTGSTTDIPHAVDDFVRQARNDVATVDVKAHMDAGGELVAKVDIHNKTGHRFPTGVGFRRAFLEFVVREKPESGDGEGQILWSSGRTNSLGVLVDSEGKPLPCEFFNEDPNEGKQAFQPHHDVITSPGQVQIYETLLWSTKHRFTTSFIHGADVVKDNRLLPRGWSKEGPGPALNGEFLRATHPCESSLKDPRYVDGSGSDEVTYRVKLPAGVDAKRLIVSATLYYQAIPPYFLKSLFTTAPAGPATQRLHYICSNMDLRGTAIENWKLPVVSATAEVAP